MKAQNRNHKQDQAQVQNCADEVEVFVDGRFMLVSRERAQLLSEYEAELDRLLAVIRYGGPRVLDALGLKECPECGARCVRA